MGCRERSVRRQGGKSMGLKVGLKVEGLCVCWQHYADDVSPFFVFFLLSLFFFFSENMPLAMLAAV